jgi:hypothetical protein
MIVKSIMIKPLHAPCLTDSSGCVLDQISILHLSVSSNFGMYDASPLCTPVYNEVSFTQPLVHVFQRRLQPIPKRN